MSVFTCEDCGWKGHPSFELSGNKLYAKCCNDECNHVDRRFTADDFREGVARTADGDVRVAINAVPVVATVTPIRPLSAPVFASMDVLGMVRARVSVLELEVAKLEGLKTELRKLNKMLKAADKVDE